MRVIGAGFGRTGTLSFKRALEDLGVRPDVPHAGGDAAPVPHRQVAAIRPDRRGRLGRFVLGVRSGVDFPVRCVWEQWASHFPEAKVVLSVRDPEQWWASTASTIYGFRTAIPAWILRSVPVTRHFVEMVDRLVWDGIFDGRFTDRDHAIAIFERHIEHVRAICPPERLLVFDVADGWGPLCAFLEVPVPQHPFPHLNDAKVTRRVVNSIWWGTRVVPVIAAAAAAGVVIRRRR